MYLISNKNQIKFTAQNEDAEPNQVVYNHFTKLVCKFVITVRKKFNFRDKEKLNSIGFFV